MSQSDFVVYVLLHVSAFFIHWNDLSKTNHQNLTLILIHQWKPSHRLTPMPRFAFFWSNDNEKNKQMNFDWLQIQCGLKIKERMMPSRNMHGSIRFVFVWAAIMLEKIKRFCKWCGHFSLSIALCPKYVDKRVGSEFWTRKKCVLNVFFSNAGSIIMKSSDKQIFVMSNWNLCFFLILMREYADWKMIAVLMW